MEAGNTRHGSDYGSPELEIDLINFWCFNTTFNNISAVSWRPVLVVEEAGVPGENHRPWASNW
jgi:hypothetical protein